MKCKSKIISTIIFFLLILNVSAVGLNNNNLPHVSKSYDYVQTSGDTLTGQLTFNMTGFSRIIESWRDNVLIGAIDNNGDNIRIRSLNGKKVQIEDDAGKGIAIEDGGNVTFELSTGVGNAYACFDADGIIYRSADACV